MNTPCANSQYLAAYLAEQERGEKREEWIEREAAACYAEMQPLSHDQIIEAITEISLSDEKKLVGSFYGSDDADLGFMLREAVKVYWLACCRQQAADEYDDSEEF